MKKFLIVFLVLILKIGVLKSDVSLTGYQEFIGGSADQTMLLGVDGNHGIDKGGFSNGIYSRVMLKANRSTESGIEIVGTYTLTRDCRSDTDNCGVSANENALAFGGSFGTIAFGETGTAGTSLHSRLTAGIPTAEPDGLLYTHFITLDSSNTYTGPNETKYASNPMTIKYFSNSYSGFSFGISHTTNTSIGGGDSDSNNQQTADYTAGSFNDLTEVVAKYETAVDSMNIAFTYGYGMGNAGSQGASEYEDLNESTYSLALSYGGVSADYRTGDRGSAGRIKDDGSGGQKYTSYCAKYSITNISVGYCEEDSDFTTSSNTTNNQSTRTIAAGYDIGGGANIEVAYFNFEQSADAVVRTDADGMLTKLSFGF